MKRYILGMSVNKRELGHQLCSAALPLTEHLAKLYMFPDADCRQHWCHEIWSFAHLVPKLKHNNRFPSSKFIFENLSGYADSSAETIQLIQDEYSSQQCERFDSAELECMMIGYLEWLSDVLANNGKVSSSEVCDKLEELGF